METTPSELAGKRVTVMGLGRFGGGVGAVRFLLDQGALVTLTDLQTEDQLAESLSKINRQELAQLVLGEHRDRDFSDADLLVVNPGIRIHYNRFTNIALKNKVPITTEINLFWERCRGKKIVVTGTVGKSTTASLIHHLLKTSHIPCRIGGNIGISLLPEVDSILPEEWIVLELSSFQLEYLTELQPRAEVVVVTNFSPNHIEWHGDLNQYRHAKQQALRWQTPEDLVVLHDSLNDWEPRGESVYFGNTCSKQRFYTSLNEARLHFNLPNVDRSVQFQELPESFQQHHLRLNLAAALSAVHSRFQIPFEKTIQSLHSFEQLPHRLEFVHEIDGVRFINDSKATTIEATTSALDAVSGRMILLIGGKKKNVSFESLCKLISTESVKVACFGEAGCVVEESLKHFAPKTESIVHDTLEEAFRWAVQTATSGDTILLSPACSSADQFANYEERGELFRQLVRNLKSNTIQ